MSEFDAGRTLGQSRDAVKLTLKSKSWDLVWTWLLLTGSSAYDRLFQIASAAGRKARLPTDVVDWLTCKRRQIHDVPDIRCVLHIITTNIQIRHTCLAFQYRYSISILTMGLAYWKSMFKTIINTIMFLDKSHVDS